MTRATWYSVGLDLSQTPWQIAMVDASGVESVADGHLHGPTSAEPASSEPASEHGDAEGIVAAVRQIAAERGGMPASVALHAGPGRGTDRLAREVARRLGMDTTAVQLIVADSADGKARYLVLPSALALVAARAAASIGHVSTLGPAAAAGPTGLSLSSGGVGPAGVSLGSGAAGPAGVSLGAGGAVGAAGVPLGASSVSGPLGVPIGAGQGVGPIGKALPGTGGGSGGGLAAKLLRLPVVVGAAAALIVVSAVVVVASRDDAPAATPRPIVTGPVAVAATVAAPTTLVATMLTPTTVAAVTAARGAACAVGSWLADNDAFLAAIQAAAFDVSITWDLLAGAMRVHASDDTKINKK